MASRPCGLRIVSQGLAQLLACAIRNGDPGPAPFGPGPVCGRCALPVQLRRPADFEAWRFASVCYLDQDPPMRLARPERLRSKQNEEGSGPV